MNLLNVANVSSSKGSASEFETLAAASPTMLDAIPGAVYVCDRDGLLVRYNQEAATLWGKAPPLGKDAIRFCGAHRLLRLDGSDLSADECPMAEALRTGAPTRNAHIILEREDGSRLTVLVNVRVLKSADGAIEGAINCFQDISAQHAMAEKLRETSDDLEDFFNNGAVGLHIVNGEGIIVRANDAELAMLGYDRDEYVGRHIGEFHADADVVADILRRLSRGEQLEAYPARLRASDGTVRHVHITSNGRFEKGEFRNTRCFTIDVTRLHDAQAAKREADERLAATYEAATVGIAEADAEGCLLRVNDAICKMLGRPREQLLGMSFFEYTDPEDEAEDRALYRRQVAGEIDQYELRKRAKRADGSLVYLDVHSSSVRDTDGFRYGVRVIQDVTAAQLSDERLRESERHMRNLLEALPAAVYTTDGEGRINFFNRASVEMAGRVPAIGDKWCVTWKLFNPDGSPLAHDECPLARALREDRPIRGEEAIAERPDGSRVPFIPYPTPLHDADGKLVGAINMLVDITERKDSEMRQKALIDELNHRVKNTLATVQSLAGQTARHASSAADLYQRLELRILALARAHDLLTRRHWSGASFDRLADEILLPVAGPAASRMSLDGPAVALSPRLALSLTMVLNELATNAAKYGAFSTSEGRLEVSWALVGQGEARCFDLRWTEMDGPSVTAPGQQGLGTRLMQRCIVRDLGGEFDLQYPASGAHCRISVPLGESAR